MTPIAAQDVGEPAAPALETEVVAPAQTGGEGVEPAACYSPTAGARFRLLAHDAEPFSPCHPADSPRATRLKTYLRLSDSFYVFCTPAGLSGLLFSPVFSLVSLSKSPVWVSFLYQVDVDAISDVQTSDVSSVEVLPGLGSEALTI